MARRIDEHFVQNFDKMMIDVDKDNFGSRQLVYVNDFRTTKEDYNAAQMRKGETNEI